MNKHKKQAFTLVELIVVITILAILGTISYISLKGYSSHSRDSVRISDMSSMKTGLELFNLDAGKYPSPSDDTVITYSGAVAWTQGYFGEQTTKNTDKLDKIPTDPLTDKKYVYSTTNTRQEFQLAGIIEGDQVTFLNEASSPFIREGLIGVSASEKTAILKISGNYNGKVLKVATGSTSYVLAVPSIITSSGITLESIITNNLLTYNGYKNLPFEYEGGSFKTLGETNLNLVNSSNLVVYQGNLATLSDTTPIGVLARKTLIENLQNAYVGTTIKNVGEIQTILQPNIIDTKAIEFISTALVSYNLGGSIVITGSLLPIGWMALDSNCKIPDIEIYSGATLVQTWAGCNTTLDTGLEYTDETSCFNYDKDGNGTNDNLGSVALCGAGNYGDSNDNAKYYYASLAGTGNLNGDTELDNIWGKIYTWYSSVEGNGVNLDNNNNGIIDITEDDEVCPGGYHIPSDTEWSTLEQSLGCSSGEASRVGWGCDGQGFKFHSSTNSGSSIADVLKIPISGWYDGTTFYDRGDNMFLSASTPNAGDAYGRGFYLDNSSVYRGSFSQANGFLVRCIKD